MSTQPFSPILPSLLAGLIAILPTSLGMFRIVASSGTDGTSLEIRR